MANQTQDIEQTLSQGKRRPGRVRGRLVVVVALLGVAGLGFWLLGGGDDALISYETQAVARGPLTVTVTATGTVQPTQLVEISSELSGLLAEVNVDFNDRVEVGQVLARLDHTKLTASVASAEAKLQASIAGVAQAEASLREARVNLDTAGALTQRGVNAQQNLVAVEAAHDRAVAQLEIAKADRTLSEANLALQRVDLEKTAIRSPIRGIVLDRAADEGQIVASSLSAPVLFTIAEDLTQMELQVDVDEADIGRLQVGNPARFSVDAYSGQEFQAKVTSVRFAPETTDGVVTYKAVLGVDNSALLLRPGMTATATITVAQLQDALLVPNAALRFMPPQVKTAAKSSGSGLLGLIMPARPGDPATLQPDAQRKVWVLRDGAPVQVAVAAADTNGTLTAISSGDLAVGDLVITDQSKAK